MACLSNMDLDILQYGLAGSLSAHAVLCVLMNPYYAANAILLAGSAALAVAGVFSFVVAEPAPYTLPLTADGGRTTRIMSNSMLVYQLFNVVVTFQVKELRSVTMMLHHLVVILLAVTSMRPFALGFTAYCFGVVELSTVALTARDMIDHYAVVTLGGAAASSSPVWPRLAVTKSALEGFFVMSFFSTRVFGWAFMSYQFFVRSAQLLCLREDMMGPGGLTMAVALWLLANAFLSVLQVRNLCACVCMRAYAYACVPARVRVCVCLRVCVRVCV